MRNVMRARKRELLEELQGEGMDIGAEEVPFTPDIGKQTMKQALRNSQSIKELEFPYVEQVSK